MIAILNQDYDPGDDIKKNELLRRIYRNITGGSGLSGYTWTYIYTAIITLGFIISYTRLVSSSVTFQSLRVEPAVSSEASSTGKKSPHA